MFAVSREALKNGRAREITCSRLQTIAVFARAGHRREPGREKTATTPAAPLHRATSAPDDDLPSEWTSSPSDAGIWWRSPNGRQAEISAALQRGTAARLMHQLAVRLTKL